MHHPDKDQILKFVLNTLENEESESVDKHLSECNECRQMHSEMKIETDIIAGFDPTFRIEAPPFINSNKRNLSLLFRIAAVLLIGFFLGYSASFISQTPFRNVIPHYLSYKAHQSVEINFFVCEGDGIGAGYDY